MASRLSFGLWDSLPDQPLLDAAAAGQLATRDQVVRQAERMVGDLRARAKLREFFLQWLKVDQVPDIAKDPKRFPAVQRGDRLRPAHLARPVSRDVICGEAADFRQLLLADYLYLNGRLAQFYGADLLRRRPVPEGQARQHGACRRADASLLDGEFRLHGDQLADPSRRVHFAERAGPRPAAAARGRCPAGARSASRS